jgi:hypothetical protein|tara:strand:- start:874 stop:1107 length:234 start_codon:yes stop_codon:yes gene_type:complete
MALTVQVPIAAVAVFLIWQDYQTRQTSMFTNPELKSAQINAHGDSSDLKAPEIHSPAPTCLFPQERASLASIKLARK